MWQVVALGGGPAGLSLVAALAAGGMLASTLLGGALADRVPQRHILLAVELIQAPARRPSAAVLALTGRSRSGTSPRSSLVGGLAIGLYYPAYSALVPALVPEGDLLAANGLEGVVRPVLAQAAGPAVAGFLVAAFSPGAALAAAAVASLTAAAVLWPPSPDAGPPRPHRRRRALAGLLGRRPRGLPSTWCGRRGCSRRCCSPR